jgi:hypothetical protein
MKILNTKLGIKQIYKKRKKGASRLKFIGTESIQSIFDYNKLSKYRPISNLGKFVMHT